MIDVNCFDFLSSAVFQIHQVELCIKVEASDISLSRLSSRLSCKIEFEVSKLSNTVSSSQKEIYKLLREMNFDVDMEVSPFEKDLAGSFFSIDIVIRSLLLAIEFDGPSHFLSNRDYNGASKSKTRLLQKIGFAVIRIPYFEWDVLSSEQKKPYLEKALQYSKRSCV